MDIKILDIISWILLAVLVSMILYLAYGFFKEKYMLHKCDVHRQSLLIKDKVAFFRSVQFKSVLYDEECFRFVVEYNGKEYQINTFENQFDYFEKGDLIKCKIYILNDDVCE